jgi:hypothetical protein
VVTTGGFIIVPLNMHNTRALPQLEYFFLIPNRCNKFVFRFVLVVGPAGLPARPRTQHDYQHDMKVKPEAATAVIELLMMGGKMPETC